MKIITIGDNVVDCYLDQRKYYPGGNCVNVAVNCKRSGAVEVGYIGLLATDDKASHIKYVLQEEKIDFKRSRIVDGISGQPNVNLSEDGERIFVGGPRNTVQHQVKIRLVQDDYDYLKKFDVCHTSCYSFLEEELPGLSEHIKISFDFSNRREPDYLARVCPHISFGFFSGADLSEEELEDLVGELEKYNLEVIGLTRGSKQALFIYKGNQYKQDIIETKVVDTMGAGDSFIGGFLTAFIDSQDMVHSLEVAAKTASITCGFYGGFGYPKKLE